jgi:cyclic patellamide precursor peptide PatG
MDQLEPSQQVEEQPSPVASDAETAPGPATATASAGAATAGPALPVYVYAIGRVEPRFPSLAVEKEFAQILGRSNNAGVTDREALQQTLADRANRYLARRVCWIFLVENLETYILVPRDPADLDLLIDAVRAEPGTMDVDVVVGQRGPIAPPELCGGLSIPVVIFDQIWSFPRDALLEAIPRPGAIKDKTRFEAIARELFDRVTQLADNAGATDQHRALNYLTVRYPAIYTRTAEAYAGNASLSAVDVRPSRLAGIRNIVDVVFSYTHRETDVTERYFVRVDVTEEFPFLVSRLAPFYDR